MTFTFSKSMFVTCVCQNDFFYIFMQKWLEQYIKINLVFFGDRCHLFFASNIDVAPYLIKVEFPSHTYATYNIWLTLGKLKFVGKFVIVINVF